MTQQGYIYILFRADFIQKKQYIYKIGQTGRYPPHKRLWDYPYGSLFLHLFKIMSHIQFEKLLKTQLENSNLLIWRKDIGLEYFEGDLQVIIDILVQLYPKYQPNNQIITKCNNPINDEYLLVLNRLHYIVNYDPYYFQKIFNCQFYSTNDQIPSEQIYKSYQLCRQWHPIGYPDNYVIRHGLTPIKPNKIINYDVPQQQLEKKIKIKLKNKTNDSKQETINLNEN